MDEAKAHRDKAKGEQAKRERQAPLVHEFLTKAKDACHKRWQESEPDEDDLRDRLYYRLKALEDIEACFKKTIADGELADANLKQLTEETKT